jgi:hypothetical protein
MILIHVSWKEGDYSGFYELLARDIQGRGAVYLPHPHIPPEARFAAPLPSSAVVGIDSSGDFSWLCFWLAEFLRREPSRALKLETPTGAVELSSRRLLAENELRARLLGAG